VVGEFAYLRVKDVTSFGAFMDWGLEKDLLVPSNQQQNRMIVGKYYIIKVCLDDQTGRVYGTNRITSNCEKNPTDLAEGQPVDLLIYGITKIGVHAVVNNRYAGLLYRSDVYGSISIGDRLTGYIGRIREDGKIDLTLKSPGYRSIAGSGEKVLDILSQRGGFIPCHDKTPPDEIRRVFSMSKKEFKKAVGGLYKSGRIHISEKGIHIP
jgi:predicted RNA-binding protein (virulence factor B family)